LSSRLIFKKAEVLDLQSASAFAFVGAKVNNLKGCAYTFVTLFF
jgi:hypothetical protein